MTDSVSVLGTPTRYTDSLHWSYVRTYGRTNGESWSPRRDNSPLVTRTRTYGIEVNA